MTAANFWWALDDSCESPLGSFFHPRTSVCQKVGLSERAPSWKPHKIVLGALCSPSPTGLDMCAGHHDMQDNAYDKANPSPKVLIFVTPSSTQMLS